jgi:hypothetical protein
VPIVSIQELLGVQRLDHHLLFGSIRDEQVANAEYCMHGINNLVKAAGSSPLLRKPNNAERVAFTVLYDSHNFGSKGNFLHVEV